MTIEEIRDVLARALPMRPPTFSDGTLPASRKIETLGDYLLESAYMQAELEEAYHYLSFTVETLKAKVERMEGWEAALPSGSGRPSQAAVLTAKRIVDPATFEAGAEARQLRDSVKRQIDRFRFEAGQGPISRAYTLITGG